MRYSTVLSLLLIVFSTQAEKLDVQSDKPLKQLYFRYAEGSLKNAAPEKWIKRWGRFDGVVLKAFNEEVTGFTDKTTDTLRNFKHTYPNKLLLLHFNGRASLPDFAKQYANSKDYLYFLGTSATSQIPSSEEKSTIKVENTEAFSIRKNLRNNSKEDVVIVARNSDGTLNWKKTEHAKLISVNKNGSITVQRDLLNTGKLSLKANQAYIAQHVAKGPFAQSEQRLWEYNWFAFNQTSDNLQKSLPLFLARNLKNDYHFFDGIQFDVLTEAHRTDNIGYPMKIDANADGKPDSFSPAQYDKAHSNGVYSFLTNLRDNLGEKTLILADGSYANQRATWLLNGIESESWPENNDPELTQWSSGLNRHAFWNEFAQSPKINYVKIAAYHVPNKGKVEPADNNRRLVVAAAMLTDSAVVPAFRPRGMAFHKWPEFRKLKNIGAPISKLVTLTTAPLSPAKLTNISTNTKMEAVSFTPQSLNNLALPISSQFCLDIPKGINNVVVKLTAKSTDTEQLRPDIMYIGNTDKQHHTYVGASSFTSWFSWQNAAEQPICLTVEGNKEMPEISELLYSPGNKVEARAYEKAVLFANNNDSPIALTAEQLTPIAKSVNIEKIMKGRKELTLPAKDIMLVRYQ